MNWLKQNEYVPYASDSIGTVHIHHCKDGKDNDKLFITRCKDGYTILAYCHHCHKSGRADTLKSKTILQLKELISLDRSSSKGDRESKPRLIQSLPRDVNRYYKEWGRGAYVWLKRYGITDEEIAGNNIGYSETYGRVVLPMIDGDDNLEFYQLRKVNDLDDRPKYITRTNVEHTLYIPQAVVRRGLTSVTVVLTEDVLSSIKVNRIEDSIALLGTSINTRVLTHVIEHYNNVIIWLDDDNNEVRLNQLKIKRRLEPYITGDITIIHGDKDPKELTDEEIEEVLKC